MIWNLILRDGINTDVSEAVFKNSWKDYSLLRFPKYTEMWGGRGGCFVSDGYTCIFLWCIIYHIGLYPNKKYSTAELSLFW